MSNEANSLSYRERDQDATLEEHEQRITRLETAGLIVGGYMLNDGANFVVEIVGII